MRTLSIVIESLEPLTIRAAHQARKFWPGPASIKLGAKLELTRPESPQILIARASIIRDALSVRWARAFSDEDATRATELALTSAAWDGTDDFESWRVFSKPPPPVARLNVPDPARNWLLCAPEFARNDTIAQMSPESLQLHFIGMPRPWPTGSVAWWPSKRIAAFLLGRVVAAALPPGPLGFDALRTGVPVLDPATLEPMAAPRSDGRLAGLIPPTLVGSDEMWRHIAEQTQVVARGATPQALCTAEWIVKGRQSHNHQQTTTVTHTRRKIRKLWREPARFFAESPYRLLRSTGAILFAPDSTTFEQAHAKKKPQA